MNCKYMEFKQDGNIHTGAYLELTRTELDMIRWALRDYTAKKDLRFETRMKAGDMAREIEESINNPDCQWG